MQIVSTCLARDLPVYKVTYRSLHEHLPGSEVHVVTRKEDFGKFRKACGRDLFLWDEADLIPSMNLQDLRKFPLSFFPKGAGWYFQQFLKLSFSDVSNNDEHFLIWDADTVLLKPLHFFDSKGIPIYTRASEYHRPYFETFQALFDMDPEREFSFIAQHQVINKKYLADMLGEIESRNGGKPWPWAIMENLKGAGTNLFSEYETYGHYVKRNYPNSLVFRNLQWTRTGGGAMSLPPWQPVLRALARNHDFAAFEASDGISRRIVRSAKAIKTIFQPRCI